MGKSCRLTSIGVTFRGRHVLSMNALPSNRDYVLGSFLQKLIEWFDHFKTYYSWMRLKRNYLFSGLLYSPVSVLPNMKLAEFRYGREEMLALFDKNVREILWSSTLVVWTCEVKHPLELTAFIRNTKSMSEKCLLNLFDFHGAGEISRGVGTVWQSLRGEDTVST